jgi:hypothetical protein
MEELGFLNQIAKFYLLPWNIFSFVNLIVDEEVNNEPIWRED